MLSAKTSSLDSADEILLVALTAHGVSPATRESKKVEYYIQNKDHLKIILRNRLVPKLTLLLENQERKMIESVKIQEHTME